MNLPLEKGSGENSPRWPKPADDPETQRHPMFRGIWFAVNALLVVSIFLAMYSAGWEISTRR
jgi:hypothetical protein